MLWVAKLATVLVSLEKRIEPANLVGFSRGFTRAIQLAVSRGQHLMGESKIGILSDASLEKRHGAGISHLEIISEA